MSQCGVKSNIEAHGKSTEGCLTAFFGKIKDSFEHNEKVLLISSVFAAVVLALLAVGLIGMSGAIASSALLIAGLSILVVSFVVLTLCISRLIIKNQTEGNKNPEDTPFVIISDYESDGKNEVQEGKKLREGVVQEIEKH